MTVAEMLFIIMKITVERAYIDGIINDEEYDKYITRFMEVEEE